MDSRLFAALAGCPFGGFLNLYRDISVLWVRRRTSFLVFLLFMSVMTPLTFYLALADPVSDCGCFGDAVSLTNWETFGKNVVLLGLSVLVFRYRRLMVRFVSERNQWMISLYSIFFAFVLAGFCIYYLPVFDFRPYHIGVNLPRSMVVPEGEEEPEYLTTFVLEKDGVKKEFTTEDYPEDTAWLCGEPDGVGERRICAPRT